MCTPPYAQHIRAHACAHTQTHKAFSRNKDLKQFDKCFISVVGPQVREICFFVCVQIKNTHMCHRGRYKASLGAPVPGAERPVPWKGLLGALG